METVKNETRHVALAAIQVHPDLQPRSLELLKVRERARQEEQSEHHIRDMALLLVADPTTELYPVHLADVGGVLYMVDGHHRLASYKRAKRETIPARVEAMTLRKAHTASKLANVQGAKLAMQIEQKRNALWHYLAAVTHGGTLSLPAGETQRKLAGQFGVSRDTLQRMLAKLPEVDPTTFDPKHLDGITGWPHWRWAKATVRNALWQAMTPEARTEWQAEKYIAALRKLWEKYDPAVVALAHRKMAEEGAGGDGEPEPHEVASAEADMAHALGYADAQQEF